MLEMNRKMRIKLENLNRSNGRLPTEMREIISRGFSEIDGCIFLKSRVDLQTNASAHDFPDQTGYEVFVNSLHMDSYVESNFLYFACLFAEGLLDAWRMTGRVESARAIISSDDFDSVVKFHIDRKNESYLDDDLERYEEGILTVDSKTRLLF